MFSILEICVNAKNNFLTETTGLKKNHEGNAGKQKKVYILCGPFNQIKNFFGPLSKKVENPWCRL